MVTITTRVTAWRDTPVSTVRQVSVTEHAELEISKLKIKGMCAPKHPFLFVSSTYYENCDKRLLWWTLRLSASQDNG